MFPMKSLKLFGYHVHQIFNKGVMNMAKKIIELKHVCKSYGDNVIIDDLNLYVNKGEFVTILGPSGCGKSTTLRMVAGFDIPTSGQILLNGVDITKLPPYKRPINTVFQKYALFPHLDVYDNVAFGLKIKKIPDENKPGKFRYLTPEEIDEKVINALKIVDLEDFENRDISTLSGGQQQRVAIARAIVMEPEIILLDEPLGALDLKMRKDMQLELKEMHKKLGITFIYVTHDQEEALTMSDTIVVMNDGIIQQIGRPNEIYDEPANAFVADFIGESNIYTGTIMGPKKVKFLNCNFDCVDDFAAGEKVDVVVRPEDIDIVAKNTGALNAVIDSRVFKGVHYQYILKKGKAEIEVQSTDKYNVGEEVGIFIEPNLIHIMKKEVTTNIFEGYIDKNNHVCFGDGVFECDVTQLYPNSIVDEDGYLITSEGEQLDLTDKEVMINIAFNDITLTDNEEDGMVYGVVISSIYKGDHYQVIIRTDENEEDYIMDTEYTYNQNDRVGIIIPSEKIKLTLKEQNNVK